MPAARLLIGPLLRRVVGTRATVWVETSGPTVVRVRTADGAGGQAETFTAYDHHYALVVVEGLEPGSTTSYEVFLDDERVWPQPGTRFPPSVIRTRVADDADQPVRLIFGSCRETTQHATARRLPPDALDAYARRLMAADGSGGDESPGDLPDLLVLLGDQVYADVTSPTVRRLLKRRRRRLKDAPTDQVVSFDEYTKLYLESWRDPEIRWLFSTLPTVMIFDDHEIIDDWNTSASWRDDAGAPVDLLADPQPGARRVAPADAARLVTRSLQGHARHGPGRRRAPARHPLAQTRRTLLRQRRRHTGALGASGRGDHRGHDQGRKPPGRRPLSAHRGMEIGRRLSDRVDMMSG